MVNYIKIIKGELINIFNSKYVANFNSLYGLDRYIPLNNFIGFFQKLNNSHNLEILEQENLKGLKNNKTYIDIKIDFNA